MEAVIFIGEPWTPKPCLVGRFPAAPRVVVG